MQAVDRLRRDHKVLRAKLSVLETAVGMGPETWYVLREVCFTLARQLRDHIRREDELVTACRTKLNPMVLAEVVLEHHDEPQHLRAIIRMFNQEAAGAFMRVKPALLAIIRALRHHMDEEERELFPLLERFMQEEGPPPTPVVGASPTLDETMTVNRVVQEFPHTKRVFEGLFINIPIEGCNCLDEVAWRHGMEAGELLERLERTIAACECSRDKRGASNRIATALESVSD